MELDHQARTHPGPTHRTHRTDPTANVAAGDAATLSTMPVDATVFTGELGVAHAGEEDTRDLSEGDGAGKGNI